jgi:hypothetical protein
MSGSGVILSEYCFDTQMHATSENLPGYAQALSGHRAVRPLSAAFGDPGLGGAGALASPIVLEETGADCRAVRTGDALSCADDPGASDLRRWP